MDFQNISIGTVAALLLLDKLGVLNKLPIFRNGNGNGHDKLTNGKQDQINKELFAHAATANSEMSEIRTDIAVVKTKITYIEEGIKRIEAKL